MRTKLRRSFLSRLGLVIAMVLVLGANLPSSLGWAQDSGAASFTVASANGNVVIKRADGSSEMARTGTQLFANDQLASVGRSEAALSPVGTGATSGASLLLFADTTVGIRGQGSGAGASTFYVADIAQGVVLAKTPPSSAAGLRVTSESAGAVAQVNPGGGMAVASDVGTGTIAVSCDDRQSQVFFPYVDDRVPCENNIVRTLSNNRTVDDSKADSNSPITSAVQAAGTNVASAHQSENSAQPQGAVNRSNSVQSNDEKEKESNSDSVSAPVVSGPVPSGPGQPCNNTTISGGAGVTTTTHELGRSSGTFGFSYDALSIPDQFDIFYEGRLVFTTGTPVSGAASQSVTYSGSSTQIVVRVTGSDSGTAWSYVVNCPIGPTSTPTATPTSVVVSTSTPTPTPTSVGSRATHTNISCLPGATTASCTISVSAADGASPPPTGQVQIVSSQSGSSFSPPSPCTLAPSSSFGPNVSSCIVTYTPGTPGSPSTLTATYIPGSGFSFSGNSATVTVGSIGG